MEGLKGILAFICAAIVTSIIAGAIGGSAIFDGFLGVVVGLGLIVGLTFLFYNIFDNLFKNAKKGVETAKIKSEIRKENQRLTQELHINEQKYQSAKNSYRYFSDEKIAELLKVEDNTNPFERLALEETGVERGIIDHSPMHEKLNNIQKHFS
ncbi:hypothetical protein [Bizionia sp.]|uniref:hypothetical protein n=1 Tax=Bizionia sp. TaxID=1954480 RepID=UPI003A8FD517